MWRCVVIGTCVHCCTLYEMYACGYVVCETVWFVDECSRMCMVVVVVITTLWLWPQTHYGYAIFAAGKILVELCLYSTSSTSQSWKLLLKAIRHTTGQLIRCILPICCTRLEWRSFSYTLIPKGAAWGIMNWSSAWGLEDGVQGSLV